jgi:hypothetical protein
MFQRNQLLTLVDRYTITDFDHKPIDLSDQKGLLGKQKSGEHVLVVMAEGHVAKPKRRSPEGAHVVTIILRER